MTPSAPPTSSRLRRAAAAERADLDRHRARLGAERERLQAELDRVDAGLAEIDERLRLLERLAPEEPGPAERQLAAAAPPGPGAAAEMLRGPAIRQKAVEVLDRHDHAIEALHYREWYELLTGAGYAVAGKDPLAVFLTQISRSPVIQRSTQSGVYELDRGAPARLRGELDHLHEQLRELTATPSATADLGAVRERRAQLTSEIDQTEKALEEAELTLARGAAARPELVAAG